RSYDPILETAIKPAISDVGMTATIVKEEIYTGPVYERIEQSIRRAKFCVADVTGGNPNVMWETAFAHALGKPVIFVAQGTAESIPYDVRHNRCIMYNAQSQEDLANLRSEIAKTLRSFLAGETSDLQAIRQLILPKSIADSASEFVLAVNPLSWRAVSP